MKILHFTVPPQANNAYLAYDPDTLDAVVIDPSTASKPLAEAIQARGLKVAFLVNTHGHADHTADNAPLQQAVGGKIAIHETEAYRLQRNAQEARWYLPVPPPPSKSEVGLKEGSEIKFGGQALRVIHTPGHSEGSICLYDAAGGVLFTGDTVMRDEYGRYDGGGGSFAKLVGSLRTLSQLPKETRVFPGHGGFTTLGAEADWMLNVKYASTH